jgi:hypothetical protein
VHDENDPCLGEPLCPECFDYAAAVTWNNSLGELWRRTTIYVPRALARLSAMTQAALRSEVRSAYVKVAEYQRRGLVHVHVVARLDRAMPEYRAEEIRPPAARFGAELLERAVREAVADVSAPIPEELGGGRVRWGQEVDVRQLDSGEKRGEVAGYLAKYATKSTELAGGLLHRVDAEQVDQARVREHVRGFMRAAFELHDASLAAESATGRRRDPRLPACAHAFGYRGHCLAKSRRYSTTFKALREARQAFVHEQILTRSRDATQRAIAAAEAEQRIATFSCVGIGHLTAADEYLATSEAARARERRRIGREECCGEARRARQATQRATGQEPVGDDESGREAVHDG